MIILSKNGLNYPIKNVELGTNFCGAMEFLQAQMFIYSMMVEIGHIPF